eukprot:5437239-Amphidinium_carterae.3
MKQVLCEAQVFAIDVVVHGVRSFRNGQPGAKGKPLFSNLVGKGSGWEEGDSEREEGCSDSTNTADAFELLAKNCSLERHMQLDSAQHVAQAEKILDSLASQCMSQSYMRSLGEATTTKSPEAATESCHCCAGPVRAAFKGNRKGNPSAATIT